MVTALLGVGNERLAQHLLKSGAYFQVKESQLVPSAFLVLNWSAGDRTPTAFRRIELRRRPGLLRHILALDARAMRPLRSATRLDMLTVCELTGGIDLEAARRYCEVLVGLQPERAA